MTAEGGPDLPGTSASGRIADTASTSGEPVTGFDPPVEIVHASAPKPFPSPPAAIALTPILSARYRARGS
jgi:hypothetical protein